MWRREGPDALTRSDIVGAGGLAIGRNDDGALVALDATSGSTAWRVPHRGARFRPDVAESPAIVEGEIVFSAPDGALYRVDPDSGAVRWRARIGCDASTSVVGGAETIWVGCRDGTLLRLASATGDVLGRVALDRPLEGRLALAGEWLVVPGGPHWLGAVRRDLGGIAWERTDLSRLSVVQPLVHDGSLFTGGVDGELLALDPETGRTRWWAKLEGSIRGLGAAGETLLVGTIQGRVYALRFPG